MVVIPLMGVPGALELLVLLGLFAVIGVFVGGWVYRDARARGSARAWQWAVGIPLLFLVGLVPGLLALVIYLLVRDERD